MVEGDWWPVVGDISAFVVFLAASFCVWILLPLRERQLSSTVQLFSGFIIFHLLDVLYYVIFLFVLEVSGSQL